MKPGRLDLPTIWRGCSYTIITLRWLDQNGDPINLNGWTPYAKSRSIDFHPSVTDATNGVTQIALTFTETANLPLGNEQWDWVWVNDSTATKTQPLLAGNVPIKEPTTDAPDPVPVPT